MDGFYHSTVDGTRSELNLCKISREISSRLRSYFASVVISHLLSETVVSAVLVPYSGELKF